MKYKIVSPAELVTAAAGFFVLVLGVIIGSVIFCLLGGLLLLSCIGIILYTRYHSEFHVDSLRKMLNTIQRSEMKQTNFDEFLSNIAQMTTNKALNRFLINNYSKHFPILKMVILYANEGKVYSTGDTSDTFIGKFDDIKDLSVCIKQKIFEKKTSLLADMLFGERNFTTLSVFSYKLDDNKFYFHVFDTNESLDTNTGRLFYNVLYSVLMRNYFTTIWQHERKIKELFRGILEIFITASTEEHIIETSTALLKLHVEYDRLDILLLNTTKSALRSILYPATSLISQDSPAQDVITASNARVLDLKKSVIIGPDAFKKVHSGIREKHFMALPLYFKDNIIGVVDIIRYRDEEFSQADMVLLDIFVKMLSAVLDKIEYVKEQEFHARYDGLTGILNRRAFMEKAEEEYLRYKRYSGSCAILMLDVDYFKKCNDTYGHAAGDFVLKKTSEIMRQSVRESDYLGRYGGEEFVIFLHSVTRDNAYAFAERLRMTIAASSYEHSAKIINVTVSIGVALYPADSENILELLKFADVALYQSKQTGRNKTTIFAEAQQIEN